MRNYKFSDSKIFPGEDDLGVEVIFRNPSTNFILVHENFRGSDLKILANRRLSILKPSGIHINPKSIPSNMFEFELERTLHKFGSIEMVRPIKITKKETKALKKRERILAARENIKFGYSAKVVSMYSGLKVAKIYSIKKNE
jgi:hypothetical protein